MKKQQLENLTIKDNFLFGAVMMNEDNCKGLLERALDIKIDYVRVSREKSIVYHPEYKGVRLDVYAKDEAQTCYNIEMQVTKKKALGKRSRYYQSQMDMEMLLAGSEYEMLPSSYVIFICDFDPFGEKQYRYTFEMKCKEKEKVQFGDCRHIVFLSTCGENDEEVPKELITFLKFVKADLKDSQTDFHDSYIRQLQEFIARVKSSREMEERFMVLEEMLRDERREGRTDILLEMLEECGTVPENLKEKILGETDMKTLAFWTRLAAKVESVEEFQEKMEL